MNYTIKKQSVIFELPLSDYFGKQSKRYYDKEAKQWKSTQNWINSIQDWEESFLDNFESFYSYIDLKNDGQYYNLEDAEKYLIDKGYTQEEIDLFRSTLESDQHRALADAKDASNQYEYSQKLYKMIMEQVEEDLCDNLSSITYKILDNITDKDFQANKTDQEYIRIEILKADIKAWLKENYPEEKYHLESDYIDFFHDYALDFNRKEIDQEYIDHYGTLGDSNNWLEYFQNYNEIETEIDNYRKDEAEKIDNAERASLEIKPSLEAIDQYSAKYFTKEETRKKISRQVNALKSVIKNAV